MNNAGEIVKQCWMDIPEHYPNTKLHENVVMPNHVHGILQIVNDVNMGVEVQNFGPLRLNDEYYEKNNLVKKIFINTMRPIEGP